MSRTLTSDHGEIIHFAGFHHLFPVMKKTDAARLRLAHDGEVADDEQRIGWPAYFRTFIDRDLVFLHDEASGQAMTRAEAASVPDAAARPQGPSAPGGA